MNTELLLIQIKELSRELESTYDKQNRLTEELGDKLREVLSGRSCPVCGATADDDTLFAYDYHKGSFAIACDRCGMHTPHTVSIEAALKFLDIIHAGSLGQRDTIRTKDGYKLDDDF